MKYSKGFERDYKFYLDNIDNFNFCGTLNPRFIPISGNNGMSAKDCFYRIYTEGKNIPYNESAILVNLLLCMAGINFQIKQWAEGMAEGTLFLFELSKKLAIKRGNLPKDYFNDMPQDIESEYNMPEWVSLAVLNQSRKMVKI